MRFLVHAGVFVGLLALACGSTTPEPPPRTAAATDAASPPPVSGDSGAVDATLPPLKDAAVDARPPVSRTEVAFVGGGDGKVRTYAVDPVTGGLRVLEAVEAGADPSYLAFDEARRLVFAVDSTRNRVSSFSVEPKTGRLTKKNDVASGGSLAAHVSLVPSGKYLLVSHYTSGHLSVVPVAADGTLSAPTDVVLAGAKAHYAQMDAARRTVFVPCLGANVVARYTLDEGTGTLTALAPVALPPGAGPRHLSFAPGAPFLFVLNEPQSSVTSFAYEATTGALTLVETQSTLPVDYTGNNTGAAIFAHPDGRYVYSSNRGQDTLSRFVYDSAGRLRLDGQVPTFGRTPRSFAFAGEGKFAYVANQGSGTVWGYTFQPATGSLAPMGAAALVEGLVSPAFVGAARFVD